MDAVEDYKTWLTQEVKRLQKVLDDPKLLEAETDKLRRREWWMNGCDIETDRMREFSEGQASAGLLDVEVGSRSGRMMRRFELGKIRRSSWEQLDDDVKSQLLSEGKRDVKERLADYQDILDDPETLARQANVNRTLMRSTHISAAEVKHVYDWTTGDRSPTRAEFQRIVGLRYMQLYDVEGTLGLVFSSKKEAREYDRDV